MRLGLGYGSHLASDNFPDIRKMDPGTWNPLRKHLRNSAVLSGEYVAHCCVNIDKTVSGEVPFESKIIHQETSTYDCSWYLDLVSLLSRNLDDGR